MNEIVKDQLAGVERELIETYGVTETKELLKFLASLGNVTDNALADGKVDFFDIGSFFTLIPQIAPALNGVKIVPKELGEINAAERLELVQAVEQQLLLRDFVTEELVEKGLDLALHFAQFVSLIRAAKQAKQSAITA